MTAYDDLIDDAGTVVLRLYFDRDDASLRTLLQQIVIRAVAFRNGLHGDLIDEEILAAVVDDVCRFTVGRLKELVPAAEVEQVAAALDEIVAAFSPVRH